MPTDADHDGPIDTPATRVRILAVSGSLRRHSTNTAVVVTARDVAPPHVDVVPYAGARELPHFDPDDDHDPLPAAVAELRAAVRAADALLLCTPEYAGALPGSFKNVLDWLIGDGDRRSIYEKPVAWINASPRGGAVAAHESLRTVLGFAHATVVETANATIPVTSALVGDDGTIVDPSVRDAIAAAVTLLARAAETAET